ncbi:MAG: type II toxin-antitoxin system Phd/YefM family antitoxin [Gammaproteobacteria bacterium]
MRSVTVREAREHIGKLLDAVANGEAVVILRRGKPVAKLIGIAARSPFPDRTRFREKLPAAKVSTAEVLRALREEERA